MRIIKKLFDWLLGGSSGSAKHPDENSQQVLSPAPTSETDKNGAQDVNLNVPVSTDPKDFLKELKAIPPLSKEFEKTRQEFIEELKKLASPRKPDK